MTAPHRVLFVEDYPPFKRSFSKLLSRGFGLDVTVAESGEEAIGEFGAIHPELVILDLGLPGVGGTETLQVIRALPSGDDVPVIVLTGSNDPAMMRAALELRVEGYVLKENATDEIANLIQSVFPELGGPLRERFRSLAGLGTLDGASTDQRTNPAVATPVPGRRPTRVLMPPKFPEKVSVQDSWTRRLARRARSTFPGFFDKTT